MKMTISAMAMMLALASTAGAQTLDDLQWLEVPKDAKALEWAKSHTDKAASEIGAMPGHATIEAELKGLLKAADPEPTIELLGPLALKFQRSAAHPHGILSVADRDGAGVPGAWREVLDIGALSKAGEPTFDLHFSSMSQACLAPDYTHCILSLSPGGGDAVQLREFNVSTGKFVNGGFDLAAARSFSAWLDKDTLLLETSLGASLKLKTGWPATVVQWHRGTSVADAPIVYKAQPDDAIMMVTSMGVGSDPKGIISRWMDYSTTQTLVVSKAGAVMPIPWSTKQSMLLMPPSVDMNLIALMAEDTEVQGKTVPSGSLVAYNLGDSVPDNARMKAVYTPEPGTFLIDTYTGINATKDGVHLVVDRRGVKHLVDLKLDKTNWIAHALPEEPVGTSLTLGSGDPAGQGYVVTRTGYLVPSNMQMMAGGKVKATLFADQPAFDASKFVVELKTATSKDGTEVDYFLLRPKTIASGAITPTLMTGYGAFGISFAPEYFGYTVGGKSLVPWLNRGGALVLPLIRGGGDRGEAWHLAAIREKRQNSYDDFAAVTEALIKDGFTKPANIGVFGSSNGGLLAAVMGTERPDLYGAVVSDVPLIDMLRFPKMGMGAAWTNEYGDPEKPAEASVLRTYSPFHNILDGKSYPPFMVTISTEDNRVGAGHARKLAARLEQVGGKVYFFEDQEGGHGVSDPLSRPELMADRMTFLIDTLMPDHAGPE
jgi:prolyl oligopeptidase